MNSVFKDDGETNPYFGDVVSGQLMLKNIVTHCVETHNIWKFNLEQSQV